METLTVILSDSTEEDSSQSRNIEIQFIYEVTRLSTDKCLLRTRTVRSNDGHANGLEAFSRFLLPETQNSSSSRSPAAS